MTVDSGHRDSRRHPSTDNMADTGSDKNVRSEWTKSSGDIAAQRKLEERMMKLGLLENKKYFEQLLSEKLELSIAQRDAGSEPSRTGRRRRPLRDRASSMAQQMTNVIRAKVVTDDDGCRVYTVNVLMGEFTQYVRHVVTGHIVVLSGSTPVGGGPKLSKDVTIEFPEGVHMDDLSMVFVAGVYKLRVPFVSRRDSTSGTHVVSTASMSVDKILSDGSSRSNCRTLSGSSGYDTLSCVSTPSAQVDSDNDDEKVFHLNTNIENIEL